MARYNAAFPGQVAGVEYRDRDGRWRFLPWTTLSREEKRRIRAEGIRDTRRFPEED